MSVSVSHLPTRNRIADWCCLLPYIHLNRFVKAKRPTIIRPHHPVFYSILRQSVIYQAVVIDAWLKGGMVRVIRKVAVSIC